jgi:hypothetical protein
MAFNFNWSPLTADADFYKRARDLLTTALNKSPKPPIIVDDILVNEFNLGSVPPDLEILEIGDIADDRFRGIFKMCYSGDAFLTLKTRVQVCAPFLEYFYPKPLYAERYRRPVRCASASRLAQGMCTQSMLPLSNHLHHRRRFGCWSLTTSFAECLGGRGLSSHHDGETRVRPGTRTKSKSSRMCCPV